jgi:hypothetical protein
MATVNRVFSYWRYFTMAPFGSAAAKAFSKGFFDLAAAQTPRPKTVPGTQSSREIHSRKKESHVWTSDSRNQTVAASGFANRR